MIARLVPRLLLALVLAVLLGGCAAPPSQSQPQPQSAEKAQTRVEQSLDGTWQVAEGAMDVTPTAFDREVPVPGLVDMATPAFAEVGTKSDKRQAFWYRRTFTVEHEVPAIAILKINKAKYGTKVWLNGQLVGEHLPCFTPALMDVKPHLKGAGQPNELIVRVGADRECLPEGQPGGWDFEKYLYLPGIYDSVGLILTGAPYIANVQTVPDIAKGQVRVVTEVQAPTSVTGGSIAYRVRQVRTGQLAGSAKEWGLALTAGQTLKLDVSIPIHHCRLWSPEDPFLYELEVDTGADVYRTRFGMRSFRFDRQTGRAILNGRPYIMRGTNVCAYRFFEDAGRGDKPWRAEWVRRLHQKFKGMHWNSIRYCIGFPPEIWYDIADEEGFLIQDEFPIWLLSEAPEKPTAEKIIPEYTEWMRQRWNHASVVIWDAQNESNTLETGKALQAVRTLDLSNRPWENGWAEPQSPDDCVEAHPYLFIKLFNEAWGRADFGGLKDLVDISPVPNLQEAQRKLEVPIIINEYAWLWLNRDGTPTCLTANIYEKLLGADSTTEQRRLLYAKYLAALTEFWRGGRKCAGVLHFCALGYSRAGDKPRPEGGATSDHFIDLEKLTLEPNFERYVRNAFAPVGLMIDYWGQDVTAGTERQFNVVVINDTHDREEGSVRLQLLRDDKPITVQTRLFTIGALGRKTLSFTLILPSEAGQYTLTATLVIAMQEAVQSVRDVPVVAGP
jgi:beta-galactosidase